MGTDLVALRKPKVQFNRRDDSEDEDYPQRECVDMYQIFSSWRNADVNSWPKCLQNFWWKIYDYYSAQYYAKKIRKYYSNDINLIKFASWLETFDEDIIFELSI
jgi:hypothetical protein